MITGCGVVSPLGTGLRPFWEGLVTGRSAVRSIAGFPAEDLEPHAAAEVLDVPRTDPDRAGAFALEAARQAVADARLAPASIDPRRLAVALGTTLGGMQLFERWLDGEPVDGVERVPYYAPAVRVARAFGCRGPVVTPQLACASGTQAIALAADWVRTGRADVVLAGGADLLCRFVVAGFNCLRATAAEARPFDAARRGLVLGEGGAVVVVEEAGHAARRRARPRGAVLGVGAAADATHMTAPDREGRGAARAIEAALADADLAPARIGFVSAHGTGTPYNDAMEAVAITRVFGPRNVAVNSIKGAIGHTLGAAGAFEAVLSLQVLAKGIVPPTVGLVTPDAACAGLDLVYGTPRAHRVDFAVSTSSGFAGVNAALVLGRGE